jgi:hypothetical protein
MAVSTEYLIVPDGTYEYTFSFLPRQDFSLDAKKPDEPVEIQHLTIKYDAKSQRFPPFYPGISDKKIQVVWASDRSWYETK